MNDKKVILTHLLIVFIPYSILLLVDFDLFWGITLRVLGILLRLVFGFTLASIGASNSNLNSGMIVLNVIVTFISVVVCMVLTGNFSTF